MMRAAVEADYPPLTDMWQAGWMVGHEAICPPALLRLRTHDSFAERLRRFGDDLRVIGPEGAPEGFVAFKGAFIDQFYIALDQQGRGLAGRLMTAAEAELAARGVTQAALEVHPENARAIGFYRKAGWVERGVETRAVDTLDGPFEMDLLILEKAVG